jgi:ABC-type glycerol-3-phosphate transport system substrate-binding protein
MKILVTLLLIFTLVACGTNPSKKRTTPTQFQTTEETIKLQGCEDLKKRVKEWNEKNPDKKPKVADC